MEKLSWREFCDAMYKFNQDHGYTTKGNPEQLVGVVVFTQDSFDKEYTEEQRSYRTSSDNKAFIPGQLGYSIFASCIDGTDPYVRIEQYIDNDIWKVDYCYLEH